jgi:hypothetical protein
MKAVTFNLFISYSGFFSTVVDDGHKMQLLEFAKAQPKKKKTNEVSLSQISVEGGAISISRYLVSFASFQPQTINQLTHDRLCTFKNSIIQRQ